MDIGEIEERLRHFEAAERAYLSVACPEHLATGVFDPVRRDVCMPRTQPELVAWAWQGIASVYARRGEPEIVLAASEMVLRIASPTDPRLTLYRRLHALALRNVMRFADAMEAYALAAEEGADDQSPHDIGTIILEPDWDDDLEDDPIKPLDRPEVLRFLEAHPGVAPEVLWSVGTRLLDRGETSDGIAALEELVRRAPTHPRALGARPLLERARP